MLQTLQAAGWECFLQAKYNSIIWLDRRVDHIIRYLSNVWKSIEKQALYQHFCQTMFNSKLWVMISKIWSEMKYITIDMEQYSMCISDAFCFILDSKPSYIYSDFLRFKIVKYPNFRQKCIVWSIVSQKWNIQYVLYSNNINTIHIPG